MLSLSQLPLLKISGFALTFLLQLSVCSPTVISDGDTKMNDIQLPEGFVIEKYAEEVEGARSMVLGDEGTLFVGTRRDGKVYAVRDTDGDFKADEITVIAKGLDSPNGVAFRDGALYVAEISRVIRFDDIENKLQTPPEPVVIRDDFPTDALHGWKYLAFGPDGKLYVPVGAPCNICDSEEDIYATITRMDPDGSNLEIFAEGVRNTVGFTWHPQTQELWFTENGRDWLGDDQPNDELNVATASGMHFGYPYCHQGDIPDPEFGDGKDCADYTAPVQKLGPHVAALGLKFYQGDMFPAEYKGRLLIAQHGSWNRSTPIGYRVMMVSLQGNQATKYEPFATGWLKDNAAWGRPVDVLELPDGSVLVSDDYQGLIYRVSYEK